MRMAFVSVVATVVMAFAALVAPAAAQPNQTGLVNINLSNNTVQVPVAVAANVCDVNVAAILAAIRDEGDADCEADATSEAAVLRDATITRGDRNTRQNGLINVNIEDNEIQIPIAAAANICDVNVAILVAAILDDGATGCEADAGAGGIIVPPPPPPAG